MNVSQEVSSEDPNAKAYYMQVQKQMYVSFNDWRQLETLFN